MSLAELGFPLAAAATMLLRRRISFFSGWDLVFTGEGFVPHRFFAGDGGSVASGVQLRTVLVDLFAKGSDLLCSPVSVFRVGGPFTGVGVVAGLVLPCRSASASGSLFLLSERSPRFFQRLKSILVGVPGWCLLRLHRCSRSSGGGEGALGFALGRLVQSAGPEQRRKTNRASRVLFVIFFFAGVLVVKGGCTVIQSNISSLSQKKKRATL